MNDTLKKDCLDILYKKYGLSAWSCKFIMKSFDKWSVFKSPVHICLAMIASYRKDKEALKKFEAEKIEFFKQFNFFE